MRIQILVYKLDPGPKTINAESEMAQDPDSAVHADPCGYVEIWRVENFSLRFSTPHDSTIQGV